MRDEKASGLVDDKSLRRIVSRRPRPSLAEPLQNDSASVLRTSHPRQSASFGPLSPLQRHEGLKPLVFVDLHLYWHLGLSSPIAGFCEHIQKRSVLILFSMNQHNSPRRGKVFNVVTERD